jgi:uncharacterized protein YutE (UPF0331/DUF86 family)
MITPSVQADLETLHQSLADIRKQLPLEADRLENDRVFDALTRDLNRVVSLVMRIDIAMATSLHGVLAADREECFAILATEGIITTDLADGLRAAVKSWTLLATAPDQIDAAIAANICRCFLMDFDAYAQAVRLYQTRDSNSDATCSRFEDKAMPFTVRLTLEEQALLDRVSRQSERSQDDLVRQGVRELCQRLLEQTGPTPYESEKPGTYHGNRDC